MVTRRLVSLLQVALFSGLGLPCIRADGAAEPPPAAAPAPAKTVNLARLLGGATIQLIDPKTGQPVAVSGLGAVIDDNTSSGWTPPVGRSLVLIALPTAATVSSFSLFAPGIKGRYTVATAATREAALNPSARAPLLAAAFGDNAAQATAATPARFIVLELDITESAPLRSIDVIGHPDKTATGQQVAVTPQASGQNEGSAKGQVAEVNFAATELGAKVVTTGGASSDKLIDGDTGTSGKLEVTDGKSATVVINLAAVVDIDRITLAFASAKGKVTFWSTDAPPPAGRLLGEATLDGTSSTLTIETAGISARSLTIVWTPDDGQSALTVREVGVFALARVVRTDPPLPPSQNTADQPAPPVDPTPPPVDPPPTPPPVLPPSKPVSG